MQWIYVQVFFLCFFFPLTISQLKLFSLKVETVNTSVEVHSPHELDKPCFGNISDGQSDVLAKLLQSSGIYEEKVADKIDRTRNGRPTKLHLGSQVTWKAKKRR